MDSLIHVMQSCETALEGLFLKLEDAPPGTAEFIKKNCREYTNDGEGTSLHKFDDVAKRMQIHGVNTIH